jgi:hypothetical protein
MTLSQCGVRRGFRLNSVFVGPCWFLKDAIEKEIESGERRFERTAKVLTEKLGEAPLEVVFMYSAGNEEEKKELVDKYGGEALEKTMEYLMEIHEEFDLEHLLKYIEEIDGDGCIDEEMSFEQDTGEDELPTGSLRCIDDKVLSLPWRIGNVGTSFTMPYPAEDKMIYPMSGAELIKGGA